MVSEYQGRLKSYLNLLALHRGEAKGSYDTVSTVYDEFAQVWDHHIAVPALAFYNQLMKERIPDGASILDAGAGTGERTLALLRHSQPGEIVALDASEGMLSVAQTKVQDPRVRFMTGDITDLPFGDNTFDVVSCTWAVEITDNPRQTVQEFVRVIKPGGVVMYAFCSLPEGKIGDVLKFIIDKVISEDNPLSHLLSEDERPFHDCAHSLLKQFSGGLTTVAVVAKCCPIEDPSLPCTVRLS